MKFSRTMFAATLVLVSLAAGYRFSQANADETTDIAGTSDTYVTVYRITDMPVWSADGKTFNPAILIAYIKASDGSDSWGDATTLRSYPEKQSLIVSGTRANHESVHAALKLLRHDFNNLIE